MKSGNKATDGDKVPLVISIRTKPYAGRLQNWRRGNRKVPWGVLLGDALDAYFAKQQKEKAA